jgi:hypothetical protein
MLKRLLFALFCVVMLAPVALFAQDANPMPDLKSAGAAAILALTPIATGFVIWGFKSVWAKVPASVILFAAPVLGIGVNYGIAYLSGHVPSDPVLAAAFGTGATYLREIASTLATKGFSGAITPTKLNF